MKYLLDVNVLLAMSYEPHVHHAHVGPGAALALSVGLWLR